MLVGYQLDRRMARQNAAVLGVARSNGCAFADSPAPRAGAADGRTSRCSRRRTGRRTEELIGGVERGIYVVGDKSWSIDMQRYNFQFTGQRFYEIRGGRLVGQLRDVAYQATTTEFWGSMEAVGGPQTYVLGGAFNCGKAQPSQIAAVSHGCPTALFRGVNILNTVAGGRAMSARPGRRAGPGAVAGRRLRRDRRGEQQRRPALGRQHADHQRRRTSSGRSTVISVVGESVGIAQRDRARRPRGRWCAPASRPPARPARPRTTARSSRAAPTADFAQPGRGRRRPTSSPRCRRRPRRVVRAARADGLRALRLRLARRHHDCGSARRPACGCGTSSRPATSS